MNTARGPALFPAVFLAMALLAGTASCGDDDGTNGGPCTSGFQPSSSELTCIDTRYNDVVRTQCGDVWEDCDTTATFTPNLACVNQPDTPPPNPPTVTVTGFVDVFSAGGEEVDGVTVEVYRQADLEGTVPIDQVAPVGTAVLSITQQAVDNNEVRACFSDELEIADQQVECPVPTGDCVPQCQDSLDGNEFCYQGNCYDRLRYEVRYEVDNVPTHEFLVIRTVGSTGIADPEWGVMIQYNVYLRTTDPDYNETEGTYEIDVNLLSRQDWYKIPQVMGLPSGVPAGNGAVAGEVHDCEGVRLSGAQVGILPQAERLSYFNGNPVDTVPLPGRMQYGTNRLGIYAAMNIVPGPVVVEAWGMVGGELTLLGRHNVRIFPDSATIVSINDGKPPMPE